MKHLLLAAFLLLTFPGPAPATHVERGCAPAPDYMRVPHWVENELCKPVGSVDDTIYVRAIVSRDEFGPIEYVAFYLTREAAENSEMDKWIGTAVFEIEDGRRGRMLLYGSASGRKYHAPRTITGMEV